ncbi:MAG: hypothetical protein FWJ92_09020 [Actinomycetes bacterium]|jgi:hypothetical protein|nr:hypothetical protein [Acidimicrobiia bacterium]
MAAFEGKLRVQGEQDPPISVEIDLDGERMRIQAGEVEIGDWSLEELRISAMLDGFHVRVAGEEMILDVEDDGRFALDLGLKTAPPPLRRRMAALLRERANAAMEADSELN